MAFTKYANARVVRPHISERGWGRVKKVAASPSRSLVSQASKILGAPFDPQKYLLTHSTIVASVDTEVVPGVKLGRVKVGSETVNRKWNNFRITPETEAWVNNNFDSWDRKTLAKAYPTFIGGHNFQEHVQVEELSKGRIIDAVARDTGKSLYVDILVATDLRHEQLVKDIRSKKMGTLSMGCTVAHTTCSKCGNVAVDETELCTHIKYAKGDHFYDENSKRRVIAELCGHHSIDPHGGVQFIEASWVATPAFTGAVLRNIIDPEEMSSEALKKAQEVLNTLPAEWSESDRVKAAQFRGVSLSTRQAFSFDDEDEEEEEESEDSGSVLDEVTDDVVEYVTDKAKRRIRDEMEEGPSLSPEDSTAWTNDTVIREARVASYKKSLNVLSRTAKSEVDLVERIASLNQAFGVNVHRSVYRTILKVGAVSSYQSRSHFLKVCQSTLGRGMTPAEKEVSLRIGNLLSLRARK